MGEMIERITDAMIEVDGRATGMTYSNLMREMAKAAVETMRPMTIPIAKAGMQHVPLNEPSGLKVVHTIWNAMLDEVLK